MARVTVEDCLDKEQNRFRLIHLATARAKQLLAGADPLYKCDNKSVVTALREVASGLVRFKTEEECEQDKLIAKQQETENKVAETDQEKARKALDSLFENFSESEDDGKDDDEDEDIIESKDDDTDDDSDDDKF